MCDAEKAESLTVEQASEIVGDDIAFWLSNPFMTPEMQIEKVCWWISRALVSLPGGAA